MNIIKSRYQLGEQLGKGASSQVFLGVDLIDEKKVAIKRISIIDVDSKYKKYIDTETTLLRSIFHPHIIETYDVETTSEYIYIIMEYMGGGDFTKISKYARAGTKLSENKLKFYMTQLMNGLKYLRTQNIVHRDLKPANLLLSIDQQTLKITDFGFARILDEATLSTTLCGTPLYMAPEIFIDQSYCIKSDLWSIGIIMYESLYGSHPYSSQITDLISLMNTLKSVPVVFPKNVHISPECFDLLRNLLQKDPNLRLSWPEFFIHPWFNNSSPLPYRPISKPLTIKRKVTNTSFLSYSPHTNYFPDYYTEKPEPLIYSDDISSQIKMNDTNDDELLKSFILFDQVPSSSLNSPHTPSTGSNLKKFISGLSSIFSKE